jgi:hypothetical protein
MPTTTHVWPDAPRTCRRAVSGARGARGVLAPGPGLPTGAHGRHGVLAPCALGDAGQPAVSARGGGVVVDRDRIAHRSQGGDRSSSSSCCDRSPSLSLPSPLALAMRWAPIH